MKNLNKLIYCCLASSMFLTSCGNSSKIDGKIEGVKNGEIVVSKLNINKFDVLDTIKINKDGNYSYKLDVKKGDPDFIYLFYKNKPLASVILDRGEHCNLVSDTLGNTKIYGSEESLKLQGVEISQSNFNSDMLSLGEKLRLAKTRQEQDSIKALISKSYIQYYRSCLKFIMENDKSLSVIPIFFQNIMGSNMPVFSQITDALHYRRAVDSLKKVYPNSKYVKALENEAVKRENQFSIYAKLQNAKQISFPDLDISSLDGNNCKLSDIKAKAILLYFWAVEPKQNLINTEVLKPLYDKYSSKGLEIYSVAIEQDKSKWANVVNNQKLGWINVCDGLGTNSPALQTYSVTSLPSIFLIKDGVLTDKNFNSISDLESYLKSNL